MIAEYAPIRVCKLAVVDRADLQNGIENETSIIHTFCAVTTLQMSTTILLTSLVVNFSPVLLAFQACIVICID